MPGRTECGQNRPPNCEEWMVIRRTGSLLGYREGTGAAQLTGSANRLGKEAPGLGGHVTGGKWAG